MKKLTTKVMLPLLALFGFANMQAQLVVQPNLTADEMVEILVGNGVETSNAVLNCPQDASGSFDGTASNIGVDEGIILGSGPINLAVGPNDSPGEGEDNLGPGDPDLDELIIPFTSQNACILEFDFVPLSSTLTFNYVFASEEYPEYVCSQFNDVFAFFIDGAGFPAPINLAIIPGTSLPVAINSVNPGVVGTSGTAANCTSLDHADLYVDNFGGLSVQYDGFTTTLTATTNVIPCDTYHLKIAIADAGDGALDSGVFLQANTFSTDFVELDVTTVSTTVENAETAIEDCIDILLTFTANDTASADINFDFNLGGTATAALDYDIPITNVTIPAGEISSTVLLETVEDGMGEGLESVIINFEFFAGCEAFAQSDTIWIDDATPLTVSDDVTINLGESVDLTASGGNGIYEWNGGESTATINVSPTENTTYTATSSIGDCNYEESVTVFVIACEANAGEISVESSICPDGAIGAATLTGGNGDMDYLYLITDALGNILGVSVDGSFDFVGQTIGDYCVYGLSYDEDAADAPVLSVDDIAGLNAQTEACFALSDCAPVTISANPFVNISVGAVCIGAESAFTTSGDADIVSWAWDFGDGFGTSNQENPTYTYFSSGDYEVTLTVTNALGCEGTASVTASVSGAVVIDNITVNATCAGQPATFSAQSGSNIVSWAWDFGDGIGTSDEENPTSYTYAQNGDYEVSLTVTDDAGCTGSGTITASIAGPDAGTPSGDADVLCAGDAVTVSAANASVLDGDVLTYVLHNSAAGNPNMPGFVIYAASSAGVFTNDGSYPTNTALYVSSVVGNDDGTGSPDLGDPCLSVSIGYPVVMLEPLNLLFNEFCDWSVGDFVVTVRPVGGYPAYDNTAVYAIAGDYAGDVPFGENFIVVFPEDGTNIYSFSIVDDGFGCAPYNYTSEEFFCIKTPIELLSFTGEAMDEGNMLKWKSATETENDFYTLYRSVDGEKYETIATVDGAGNSLSAISYEHLDANAPDGVSYYRLEQTDFNGSSKVLGNIALVRGESRSLQIHSLTPVPANDEVNVTFEHHINAKVTVSLFAIDGSLVYSQNENAKKGINQWNLDVSQLSAGIYLLQISDGLTNTSAKLVKR